MVPYSLPLRKNHCFVTPKLLNFPSQGIFRETGPNDLFTKKIYCRKTCFLKHIQKLVNSNHSFFLNKTKCGPKCFDCGCCGICNTSYHRTPQSPHDQSTNQKQLKISLNDYNHSFNPPKFTNFSQISAYGQK